MFTASGHLTHVSGVSLHALSGPACWHTRQTKRLLHHKASVRMAGYRLTGFRCQGKKQCCRGSTQVCASLAPNECTDTEGQSDILDNNWVWQPSTILGPRFADVACGWLPWPVVVERVAVHWLCALVCRSWRQHGVFGGALCRSAAHSVAMLWVFCAAGCSVVQFIGHGCAVSGMPEFGCIAEAATAAPLV